MLEAIDDATIKVFVLKTTILDVWKLVLKNGLKTMPTS